MKRLMRSMVTIAILGLGVFGLASAFQAGQRGNKEAAAKGDPARLHVAMVDSSRTAYQAVVAEYEAGTVLLPELLYIWSNRWRAAEVRATQSKQQVARAHEDHLARMRSLHGKIEALHKAQAKGGEESKLQAVKFYVAEAELLLAESRETL